MPTVTYNEALVVFRNLCDDDIIAEGDGNEYVRGGLNLIADLFGVVGQPVSERMDDVLADLKRIPMFADGGDLAQYGVAPYVRDPIASDPIEGRLHALEAQGEDTASEVSNLESEIRDLRQELESLRADFDTHEHD